MSARSSSRLWSPFADLPSDRVESVTIVKGEGQFVFDDEGKRYLDGVAGLWYTLIGHGRRQMALEVAKQIETLEAFQTHGVFDNLPARELADRLGSLFPIEDPLVFFSSGGGDAIETASKLAREYWRIQGHSKKVVLISRKSSYHGMQGFGTSLAGIDRLREGYEDGFSSVIVANDDAKALESAIEELGSDQVAGFIAEPVIGAGGIILPTDGYLADVERICRENNVLFICDEVITGFGRMGKWSASEYYDMRPDLIAVAKGITSGYLPLGAVLAARDIWHAFEAAGEVFRHGYTYSGHPTACIAALTNLSILEDEGLVQRASELAPEFGHRLTRLTEHPVVTEVRQIGLMAGIGLDPGVGSSLSKRGIDLGAAMVRECLERGVILRRMFQGDLQVSPPLVIVEEDVEQIAESIVGAADSVLMKYSP